MSKCPKCGARFLDMRLDREIYACGSLTYLRQEGYPVEQTQSCRISELENEVSRLQRCSAAVNDQQIAALIAGVIYATNRETLPLDAVNMAREIMDVIYKTEDDDDPPADMAEEVASSGRQEGNLGTRNEQRGWNAARDKAAALIEELSGEHQSKHYTWGQIKAAILGMERP